MRFWCKTISSDILNTLANQHSYQLICSSSNQNKWDLATFISEADQVQKCVDQCNHLLDLLQFFECYPMFSYHF